MRKKKTAVLGDEVAVAVWMTDAGGVSAVGRSPPFPSASGKGLNSAVTLPRLLLQKNQKSESWAELGRDLNWPPPLSGPTNKLFMGFIG